MKNKFRKHNLGQSLLGYVVFIAIVAGAMITMKFFVTRTVQEKYSQSSDVWGEGEQYDPNRTAGGVGGSTWYNRRERCPEILAKYDGWQAALRNLSLRISKLQKEITDLEDRAKALESRADEAEAQAKRLDEAGFADLAAEVRKIIPPLKEEANKLKEQAKKRKEKIKVLNDEIKKLQKKIENLKKANPDCF